MLCYKPYLFFFKAWFPTHWFWGLTFIHTHTYVHAYIFKGQILKRQERGNWLFSTCVDSIYFLISFFEIWSFYIFLHGLRKYFLIFYWQRGRHYDLWHLTSMKNLSIENIAYYEISYICSFISSLNPFLESIVDFVLFNHFKWLKCILYFCKWCFWNSKYKFESHKNYNEH